MIYSNRLYKQTWRHLISLQTIKTVGCLFLSIGLYRFVTWTRGHSVTSCFHSIVDSADKDLCRMFGDWWNRFVSVCLLCSCRFSPRSHLPCLCPTFLGVCLFGCVKSCAHWRAQGSYAYVTITGCMFLEWSKQLNTIVKYRNTGRSFSGCFVEIQAGEQRSGGSA